MACNSKTTGSRAKWTEILVFWIQITHIWGRFYLVGFKVIGVIRCTCVKMACNSKVAVYGGPLAFNVQGHLGSSVTRKRLVVGLNGPKFGFWGYQ